MNKNEVLAAAMNDKLPKPRMEINRPQPQRVKQVVKNVTEDLQEKMVRQAMLDSATRTLMALRKNGDKYSNVAKKLRAFCKAYHFPVPACALTSKGS